MSEIERSENSDQRAPESPAPASSSGATEAGELEPGHNLPGGNFSFEIERVSLLPPPAEFREYAMLIPDGADRLMKMAEKQQTHEHRIMHRQETRAGAGVACATLSVLGTIFLSGYGFYSGHAVEGAAVFGATIGVIATVFIRGTSTKKG